MRGMEKNCAVRHGAKAPLTPIRVWSEANSMILKLRKHQEYARFYKGLEQQNLLQNLVKSIEFATILKEVFRLAELEKII